MIIAPFSKCFLSGHKTPGVFKFLRFEESVSQKLHFRDESLTTVDLTVEIKLCFHSEDNAKVSTRSSDWGEKRLDFTQVVFAIAFESVNGDDMRFLEINYILCGW